MNTYLPFNQEVTLVNVHDAFDIFDSNLNLDPDERATAQERHTEITKTAALKRAHARGFKGA